MFQTKNKGALDMSKRKRSLYKEMVNWGAFQTLPSFSPIRHTTSGWSDMSTPLSDAFLDEPGIDPDELYSGVRQEWQTCGADPNLARKVAIKNIKDNPHYYSSLAKYGVHEDTLSDSKDVNLYDLFAGLTTEKAKGLSTREAGMATLNKLKKTKKEPNTLSSYKEPQTPVIALEGNVVDLKSSKPFGSAQKTCAAASMSPHSPCDEPKFSDSDLCNSINETKEELIGMRHTARFFQGADDSQIQAFDSYLKKGQFENAWKIIKDVVNPAPINVDREHQELHHNPEKFEKLVESISEEDKDKIIAGIPYIPLKNFNKLSNELIRLSPEKRNDRMRSIPLNDILAICKTVVGDGFLNDLNSINDVYKFIPRILPALLRKAEPINKTKVNKTRIALIKRLKVLMPYLEKHYANATMLQGLNGDSLYALEHDIQRIHNEYNIEQIEPVIQNFENKFLKENRIHGSAISSTADDTIDPTELAKGITVEMEHTDNDYVAAEIAKDHLKKDPEYYSKLQSIGLTDECAPALSSGLGDQNHTINKDFRVGKNAAYAGNNKIGNMGNTPNINNPVGNKKNYSKTENTNGHANMDGNWTINAYPISGDERETPSMKQETFINIKPTKMFNPKYRNVISEMKLIMQSGQPTITKLRAAAFKFVNDSVESESLVEDFCNQYKIGYYKKLLSLNEGKKSFSSSVEKKFEKEIDEALFDFDPRPAKKVKSLEKDEPEKEPKDFKQSKKDQKMDRFINGKGKMFKTTNESIPLPKGAKPLDPSNLPLPKGAKPFKKGEALPKPRDPLANSGWYSTNDPTGGLPNSKPYIPAGNKNVGKKYVKESVPLPKGAKPFNSSNLPLPKGAKPFKKGAALPLPRDPRGASGWYDDSNPTRLTMPKLKESTNDKSLSPEQEVSQGFKPNIKEIKFNYLRTKRKMEEIISILGNSDLNENGAEELGKDGCGYSWGDKPGSSFESYKKMHESLKKKLSEMEKYYGTGDYESLTKHTTNGQISMLERVHKKLTSKRDEFTKYQKAKKDAETKAALNGTDPERYYYKRSSVPSEKRPKLENKNDSLFVSTVKYKNALEKSKNSKSMEDAESVDRAERDLNSKMKGQGDSIAVGSHFKSFQDRAKKKLPSRKLEEDSISLKNYFGL